MPVEWIKSTFSNSFANCVEIGVWHKASYSGGNGGGCVEVTATRDTAIAPAHKAGENLLYLVRDSKDAEGPALAFTLAEWDAFIAGVKAGEFDPEPVA